MEKESVKSYAEALKILTPQERKILDGIGRLYTNKEIAEELNIAVRTVQKHRENISKKIGVSGRGGLNRWYFTSKKNGSRS